MFTIGKWQRCFKAQEKSESIIIAWKIYILHQVDAIRHKRTAFCATLFCCLCPLMRYNFLKIRRNREKPKYKKAVKREISSIPSPRGGQSVWSLTQLGLRDNGGYCTASTSSADNHHSPLLSICRCQNRHYANISLRNAGRQTARVWHSLSAGSHFRTSTV